MIDRMGCSAMKMEALRGFGEWELVPLACGQPTSRAVPKAQSDPAGKFSLVAGLGQRSHNEDCSTTALGDSARCLAMAASDSAALKRVFVVQ